MRIALALREPFTGKVMEARGAVALDPPSGLRMILLGPGGTTALDLWARDDRYRFAVPALDLLRRGDARTPRSSRRGLPIDFLRWWLLRPAEGTLLWFTRVGTEDRFVLRDGGAIVDLRAADDGTIWARRTTWDETGGHTVRLDEETVAASSLGCSPVKYHQASTGLSITVRCEGVDSHRPPDPRAFEDPDAPSEPTSP
jgi:hypothetical protein